MPTEIAPPGIGPALRDEIARHMRLALPLAPGEAEEAEAAFRAALAHLEAELGLCLLPRGFVQRGWLDGEGAIEAEIGPARALLSVARIRENGTTAPLAADLFSIEPRGARSLFRCRAFVADEIELRYEAGFGADWAATPADLRRAALTLATEFHDVRHGAGARRAAVPFGVADLIRPWRPIRLSARRRA